MSDGRVIFSVEKREPGFYELALRRINLLDGGDYHPLYSQRGTIGYQQGAGVVELSDRNFSPSSSQRSGAVHGGGGALGVFNRSIGVDFTSRECGRLHHRSHRHRPDVAVAAPECARSSCTPSRSPIRARRGTWARRTASTRRRRSSRNYDQDPREPGERRRTSRASGGDYDLYACSTLRRGQRRSSSEPLPARPGSRRRRGVQQGLARGVHVAHRRAERLGAGAPRARRSGHQHTRLFRCCRRSSSRTRPRGGRSIREIGSFELYEEGSPPANGVVDYGSSGSNVTVKDAFGTGLRSPPPPRLRPVAGRRVDALSGAGRVAAPHPPPGYRSLTEKRVSAVATRDRFRSRRA